MAPAVLAGLPRTGNVPVGPARRERSGKAGPGLARDLGELNVYDHPCITRSEIV
jgi:hypothetical protein